MHRALRSQHSLAIHFAAFAGRDVEAFDPIVALEQANSEMARGTGPQVIEAETRRASEKEGETVSARIMGNWSGTGAVGNWWMEGGRRDGCRQCW